MGKSHACRLEPSPCKNSLSYCVNPGPVANWGFVIAGEFNLLPSLVSGYCISPEQEFKKAGSHSRYGNGNNPRRSQIRNPECGLAAKEWLLCYFVLHCTLYCCGQLPGLKRYSMNECCCQINIQAEIQQNRMSKVLPIIPQDIKAKRRRILWQLSKT